MPPLGAAALCRAQQWAPRGGLVPFGCCCGCGLVLAHTACPLLPASPLPPDLSSTRRPHSSSPLSKSWTWLRGTTWAWTSEPLPTCARWRRCSPCTTRAASPTDSTHRAAQRDQDRLPRGEGHRSAAQRCPDTARGSPGLYKCFLSVVYALSLVPGSQLSWAVWAGFVPPHPLCPGPFAASWSEMSGCAPAAPVPRCSPGSALPHAAGLFGQLGELFQKAELNQVVLLLPGAELLQRCCLGTHCSTAGPAALPAWLWGHGTRGPTPPCSLSHLQLLHVSASLPKTALPGGWEQCQPRSPRGEPQLRPINSVPSSAWGALQALLQLVQARGSEPGLGSAGVSRPVVCLC